MVSLAAGITTGFLEERLPAGTAVVRVMPNTPALVDEGMAAVSPGQHCDEVHLSEAEELLRSCGKVLRIAEKHLDAVTAISGSGPAYIFYVVEAMIEAGVLLGMPRTTSTELVVQTLYGAATMLKETGQHPTVLREQVSSPGGTTMAALRQLDDHKVRAAFVTAMEAAAERSKQLAVGKHLSSRPVTLPGWSLTTGNAWSTPSGVSVERPRPASARRGLAPYGVCMSEINVRALGEEDWQQYRDIRLTALQESPEAFVATDAQEEALDEQGRGASACAGRADWSPSATDHRWELSASGRATPTIPAPVSCSACGSHRRHGAPALPGSWLRQAPPRPLRMGTATWATGSARTTAGPWPLPAASVSARRAPADRCG